MASPTLKLGALQNKITAGNEQEQARSMAMANNLQLGAQLISGQGYQAGMSPFEQVAQGALLGASQGFKNKAEMKKAQAQDELNAYVKQMQDVEAETAKRAAQAEQDAAVEKKYASIIASAVLGANGDSEKLKATLPMYYNMMAKETGREVVSVTPQGDNPLLSSVTLRDADGTTETRDYGPMDFMQHVAEQDPELFKATIAAIGGFSPTMLQTKSSTGKDITFEQYQSFTPEQQALYQQFTGKGGKGDKKEPFSSILGKKGTEEIQKKRAAIIQGSAQRAAARGRIAQVQELLASGTETGKLTTFTADAMGALGTVLGVDFSQVTNVSQLNSLLKGQLEGILSIFGAGTGISNRDVENAQLIIGSVENPADALRKIQAYAAANLRLSDEYAEQIRQIDLAVRAGDMDDTEGERKLAEVEAAQFERIQALYNEELDKSLGMEQNFMRTGSTSGATSAQEITIDLDGNIVQ